MEFKSEVTYQPPEKGGREYPRFSAIKTFFRLPMAHPKENFDVALFGIPLTAECLTTQEGALLLRCAASSLGRGFHMSHAQNVFEKMKVADVGDCQTVPIDQKKTYAMIEKFVSELLKNKKRFIAVGGDHSTTLPVLRALRSITRSRWLLCTSTPISTPTPRPGALSTIHSACLLVMRWKKNWSIPKK